MPRIINKIIKTLIIGDFFLNLGWGLMGPIFAIFIVQNITVGSTSEAARVAGFCTLIYWIVKSILQIPVGRYLDKNHGEKDDFWFVVIGTAMMAIVPLGYILSSEPQHLYLIQVFYAIAASMVVPPWAAIFTRHIDKGKEAFEWSSYSTCLGIAAGLSGGVGGIAVAQFGFNAVFIFVSLFTLLSVVLLLAIRKDISPKVKEVIRIPIERKH